MSEQRGRFVVSGVVDEEGSAVAGVPALVVGAVGVVGIVVAVDEGAVGADAVDVEAVGGVVVVDEGAGRAAAVVRGGSVAVLSLPEQAETTRARAT